MDEVNGCDVQPGGLCVVYVVLDFKNVCDVQLVGQCSFQVSLIGTYE